MANQEQIEKLKAGVKDWNKWKKDNPDVEIDLSGADLSGADFSIANFSGADLTKTDLRETDFTEADLSRADLSGVDLSQVRFWGANLSGAKLKATNLSGNDLVSVNISNANLSRVNLTETDLREANLSGANLSRADLSRAKLSKANLSGVNLTRANLTRANLSRANLSGAKLAATDLSGANLSRAHLTATNLSEANLNGVRLTKTDLSEANLSGVRLTETDLSEVNLSGARLSGVDLSGATLNRAYLIGVDFRYADLRNAKLANANITGANLEMSAREGWQINGIKCDYIYFDEEGKERQPKDRNFEPGEFEHLYRSLPTIEMVFKNGLTTDDLNIMNVVTQKLTTKRKEFDLGLLSFDVRGIHPRFLFSVALEEYKEAALRELRERYEIEKKLLIEDRDRWYRFALQQPARQIKAGTYVEAQSGSSVTVNNITQAVDALKEALNASPKASFKEKSKKQVIKHLDNLALDLTKEGTKTVAKKLYEFAKEEIKPVLPQVLELLARYQIMG